VKVLLDENLPHRLRNRLGSHEAFTVSYVGWAGLKNGELNAVASTVAGKDEMICHDLP
jgi:hypothetical protein